MRRNCVLIAVLFWALLIGFACAQTVAQPATGQVLTVAAPAASADVLLTGGLAAWSRVPARHVALNRTPPLFDTDEPAGLEITTVDVRLTRASGKLLVNLAWRDATRDAAALTKVPDTAPETRFLKVPTDADDRFFDAAAVMFPSKTGQDVIAPSLQMGDPDHEVEIYYWNAARGASVMQAQGRSTTHRTGQTFPSSASYQNGHWNVTLELPDLPAGTTVAFAVWNGNQKDRDGRKYFSVWQVLE